jgi:hypothetical protein
MTLIDVRMNVTIPKTIAAKKAHLISRVHSGIWFRLPGRRKACHTVSPSSLPFGAFPTSRL